MCREETNTRRISKAADSGGGEMKGRLRSNTYMQHKERWKAADNKSESARSARAHGSMVWRLYRVCVIGRTVIPNVRMKQKVTQTQRDGGDNGRSHRNVKGTYTDDTNPRTKKRL